MWAVFRVKSFILLQTAWSHLELRRGGGWCACTPGSGSPIGALAPAEEFPGDQIFCDRSILHGYPEACRSGGQNAWQDQQRMPALCV